MAEWTDSGLRYCDAHHGIVDVDHDVCDFARMDMAHGAEVTGCVTRPLLYDASSPQRRPPRADA